MNDDHPGRTSSTDALVRQVVEEGPAYAVLVTSFDGTETGSFTVTVAEAAPGEGFPIQVEPGTRVDGRLGDDDARTADGAPMETYEFQADALDRILVLAEGDAMPTLAVSDPERDGTVASASWKDGFSFLEWLAPETGTYRLTVTPSGSGGGSFSLRIWAPPVTDAELDGLLVDDEIHHEGYGFSLPSPGPDFFPVRGLADPHQTYLDGYRRLWYLSDDEDAVLTVLYLGSFGALEDGTFKQVSSEFIRGFAAGREPRIKEEGERSVRGVIAVPSGPGTQARCIGSSSTESPGRMLCVSLSAAVTLPSTDDVLNGMVLR